MADQRKPQGRDGRRTSGPGPSHDRSERRVGSWSTTLFVLTVDLQCQGPSTVSRTLPECVSGGPFSRRNLCRLVESVGPLTGCGAGVGGESPTPVPVGRSATGTVPPLRDWGDSSDSKNPTTSRRLTPPGSGVPWTSTSLNP